MISTTDQMDKTTPEERKALIGQCTICSQWQKFDRKTGKPECGCGGKLDTRSIQSQRTFDIARAKGKKRK